MGFDCCVSYEVRVVCFEITLICTTTVWNVLLHDGDFTLLNAFNSYEKILHVVFLLHFQTSVSQFSLEF